MKSMSLIAVFFILTLGTSIFFCNSQADAAGWKKRINAEVAKCRSDRSDAIKKCAAEQKAAGRLEDNKKIMVHKETADCLRDASIKYDKCMDPKELKAAAKDVKNQEDVEKATSWKETAEDKCKKADISRANKCEKLAGTAKYDKCYAKALKAHTKCYGKVDKKFKKMMSKIK